jgi:hypothetical protein
MATYKTYIGDPLGCVPAALLSQIQSQLADLMSPCTSNAFENNWVYLASPSLVPQGWELLVYFAPAGVSIIKNAPSTESPDLDAGGNTAFGAGASEVYMKSTDPVILARLAFHELMHNRLQLGGKGPTDGLHAQGGLASWQIDASTPYTDANKNAMAAVISNPITQWTDGLNINVNDPMSEYYRP